MKLVSITLHNYLSHPDTALELDGTRLAAFVGANGAGKSALLEAIKYVLFNAGRISSPDGLVRLGQTEMSASIEFEFAGATYRATRGRSTKGAGKSYLELAVLDGETWTTLSGDDIRDTQARIVELLGVDADTFGTAVFLGQGEADRFAAATAAERKRILTTILGLEVYQRAEAQAREQARDLEATTAADRDRLERTVMAIDELSGARDLVLERQQAITEVAGEQTAAAARLEGHQARLTELAAELATTEAAAADVARLERECEVLAERYRAERRVVAEADEVLARSHAVALAAEALPEARSEVDRLETAALEDRALAEQIAPKRAAFEHTDRELATARAGWEATRARRRERVTELIEAVNGLQPVICEACGHGNIVDQAGLRAQLAGARDLVAAIEADEPKEPVGHARDRVAIERLESRRRELAWDPNPLAAARTRLINLERAASGAEAVAMAGAAKAKAEAELASIDQAGQALRTRIAEATARTEGTQALVAEQIEVSAARDVARATVERLAGSRRELERALTITEAQVVRLVELEAERDTIAGNLESNDVELGRLRRLVTAFGVTGIPARIIESVLPELTEYANDLLGELRPGMVLEVRAQRAKKDGKGVVEALDLIVRDEVGERPLSVFSGGERMSVSLAIATALSRLVARRAGAAIRTLVIDEPDGLDADARRSFGEALRVLAHHGELERVVLVSHHPDLAEFGDAVFQVTKNGAGSVVEQVA